MYNPDHDFILRGMSPKVCNARESSLYEPTNYCSDVYVSSPSKRILPVTTYPTLRPSVTKHKGLNTKIGQSKRNIDQFNNDGETLSQNEFFSSQPKSSSSEWYIKPVHLTTHDDFPYFKKLGLETQPKAAVNRNVGMLGAQLSISEKSLCPRIPQNDVDINKQRAEMTKGGFGYSSIYPTMYGTSNSDNREYFNPDKDAFPHRTTTTLCQGELARLRMEQLRLEEGRLLEWKRIAELERIRGPKIKWYEMKTPAFHYEARKNNELLRSCGTWNDLWSYHQELTRASNDFQKTLGAVI